MAPHTYIDPADCPAPGSPEALFMASRPFRSLVYRIAYMALVQRPDLAFAVNALSRVASNPAPCHWDALIHLIRYIASTPDIPLIYPRPAVAVTRADVFSSLRPILMFTDSSYADDRATSRSTGGTVIKLTDPGGAIDWRCGRLPVVGCSTAEVEYCQMFTGCVRNLLPLQELILELHLGASRPRTVGLVDNTAAISLATDRHTSARAKTRHMRVRFHRVRQCVAEDNVAFTFCPTDLMVADILTKPLAPKDYRRLLPALMGAPDAQPFLSRLQHTIARAASGAPSMSVRGGVGLQSPAHHSTDTDHLSMASLAHLSGPYRDGLNQTCR